MKIYTYWNRNNNDCTKIFHFMSPNDKQSIVGLLENANDLQIERIVKDFGDTSNIISEIEQSELVIFCTHGTPDQILKYRNNPEKKFDDYVLIDQSNVEVFNNKIILAFCCASAKRLGKICVSKPYTCKAYIGFENDIVYDNGKAKKSRHFIYQSYKLAFGKSLEYAVKSKCTVEEYKIRLLQLLRKESMIAIMKSENNSFNNMYTGTIDGLVALGDTNAVLFT